MEKNLIIAVILSVLILGVFQYYIAPSSQPEKGAEKEVAQKEEQVNKKESVKENKTLNEEKEVTSQRSSFQNEKKYVLETEKIRVIFSNIGGQVTSVQSKEYEAEKNIPFNLIDIESSKPGIGKIVHDGDKLGKNRSWDVKEMHNSIKFISSFEKGLKIEKKFTITSPYTIKLEVIAYNTTNSPIQWQYSIFGTTNIERPARLDKRYSMIALSTGKEKDLTKIKLEDVKKGLTEEPGNFRWLAEKNTYFSEVFVSKKDVMSIIYYHSSDNFVAAGAKINPAVVKGNSSLAHKYDLYLGPNKENKLVSFYNGAERIIDYGIFTPISKFLLTILKFIYSVVNNYGVAIICLTILINICLFPLTRKSYSSMRKMQELQPKISKLREQYKDDKQKLNEELMNLYKKQGGNPLGGCFPMLLQFPIFISLYFALSKSIELKGANFLWISDLAAPDAIFTLPFSLPIIDNNINLLPILMMTAMFVQQKLSAQKKAGPQASMQKKFGLIFPLVFGVILYNFPSGLILYWLTNTIIMGFVQWKIMHAPKKVEVEEAEESEISEIEEKEEN